MSLPISPAFRHQLLTTPTINIRLVKMLPTTTCPICIDELISQDDEIIPLPDCHHVFHQKCILEWFSRNNTCGYTAVRMGVLLGSGASVVSKQWTWAAAEAADCVATVAC
nr:hypothetical protein [Tanacetum cinerariifolium]